MRTAWVGAVGMALLGGCLPGSGGEDGVVLGTAERRLEVSPSTLDCGAHVVGTESRTTLRLVNAGRTTVALRRAALAGDVAFSLDEVPERLLPGVAVDIGVRFVPQWTGGHHGALTIESDAPSLRVELRGEATELPLCDDDNPCTLDLWDHAAESCRTAPVDGPCDDGNVCTEGDTCSEGACLGFARTCDDGVACTVDTCDPALGCAPVPVDSLCDDGDVCTTEHCDATAGCQPTVAVDGTACGEMADCRMPICFQGTCQQVPVIDGTPCDDRNACSAAGTCLGGQCRTEVEPPSPWNTCPERCGNDAIDLCSGFVESCDGTDLGGASCKSLGFLDGTLRCTSGCNLDVTGCQVCGDHPAVAACGGPPGPAESSTELVVAARGNEVGALWNEWRDGIPAVVHFARFDADLQLVGETDCGGIRPGALALAETDSGWLATSAEQSLVIYQLSPEGSVVRGRVVTEDAGGDAFISNRYAVLERAGPGRTLLAWWRSAPSPWLLQAAMLDDTGEMLWRVELGHGVGETLGLAHHDGRSYVAARMVDDVEIFVIEAGVVQRAGAKPFPPGSDYPRLLHDGDSLILTGVEYGSSDGGALWVRLAEDGSPLGAPTRLGDGFQYFNPAPLAVVGGTPLALLGGYSGFSSHATHLALQPLANRGATPVVLNQEPTYAFSYDVVTLGDDAVVAWLSGLPWNADAFPYRARVQLARVQPADLGERAPIIEETTGACTPSWRQPAACGGAVCGNGVIDACEPCTDGECREQCDGDVGTAPSCAGLGLGSGDPVCGEDCRWDYRSCATCPEHPFVTGCQRIAERVGLYSDVGLARGPDGRVAVAWGEMHGMPPHATRLRLRLLADGADGEDACLDIFGVYGVSLAPWDAGWLLSTIGMSGYQPHPLRLWDLRDDDGGTHARRLHLLATSGYFSSQHLLAGPNDDGIVGVLDGRLELFRVHPDGVEQHAVPRPPAYPEPATLLMTTEGFLLARHGAGVVEHVGLDGTDLGTHAIPIIGAVQLAHHGGRVWAVGIADGDPTTLARQELLPGGTPVGPLLGHALPEGAMLVAAASAGGALAVLLYSWLTGALWLELVDVDTAPRAAEPIPLLTRPGWPIARLVPDGDGALVVWATADSGSGVDLRLARVVVP